MDNTNKAITKGNLIASKKSLRLANVGYELMDRKRNILVREMMKLVDTASNLRVRIDETYSKAYRALQLSNITMGICDDIAQSVPIENSLTVNYRSVMGVELPMVSLQSDKPKLCYGLQSSNHEFDYAYLRFHEVKLMLTELAEVESSIYKLALEIKKTQSRANALNNIVIPDFIENIKRISDALEEKEREEYSRLKKIKSMK